MDKVPHYVACPRLWAWIDAAAGQPGPVGTMPRLALDMQQSIKEKQNAMCLITAAQHAYSTIKQTPGGPVEMTFLEYFFPGTLVLLVLFASIFANISVIEDRASGFMQAVLVAPIGRSSLVLGKVLGAATLSWLQGALFLVLAPLAGIALDLTAVLPVLP